MVVHFPHFVASVITILHCMSSIAETAKSSSGPQRMLEKNDLGYKANSADKFIACLILFTVYDTNFFVWEDWDDERNRW